VKSKGKFDVGDFVVVIGGRKKGMEGKILNLTSKKDGISVKILVEQSKEVLLWTNS
jgi:ribosomal protein L24